MPKPEWGVKRLCGECGDRFYDLGREPAICPNCGTEVPWSPDNPERPFCSARCKHSDFIDWADEKQVIPGNPGYDELFSQDLEDPHQH